MSIRMDSTVLTTSLHGLRGMGLILNLRYPQPARRGGKPAIARCTILDPRFQKLCCEEKPKNG
jgi:hypothetical protein